MAKFESEEQDQQEMIEKLEREMKRLRRELFIFTKDAPCLGCGYNGKDFYQPLIHDCAGPTFCMEEGK